MMPSIVATRTCFHRGNACDARNIHHGRAPSSLGPFRRRGSLEQRVQKLWYV